MLMNKNGPFRGTPADLATKMINFYPSTVL